MAATLGFYELLEPYFSFGLAADTPGRTLADVRDANADLTRTFPGSSATLLRIVTELLDYLSVEELLASVDENAMVYRGSAKFGGAGRAAPELPGGQSLTSPGGQELSWQDDMLSFRLTVPRRSPGLQFDTTGLTGPDLDDVQQLNALLDGFTDNPAAPVSDVPGADFRLELLLRTVRLVLPPDRFIPARVAADGWLEPDPDLKEVVFEFPRLAFVLEQQGAPGHAGRLLADGGPGERAGHTPACAWDRGAGVQPEVPRGRARGSRQRRGRGAGCEPHGRVRADQPVRAARG